MIVLKDFVGDGVFKLGRTSDPGGLMGRVLTRTEIRPDLGRMACDIVLTREVEDRSGDIVVVKGICLEDHARHPQALFNHDPNAPIGRFEDPAGNYTVKAVGDTLRGTIFFNQRSAFAADVFEAVADRTFSGASIGFLPVVGAVTKRHPRGTHYGACKLVEGSIVSIGDNPFAGVEAVHKALGRATVSDAFRRYFADVGPRPAVVVSGWENWTFSDATFKAAADDHAAALRERDREFISPLDGNGGVITDAEFAEIGNPDDDGGDETRDVNRRSVDADELEDDEDEFEDEDPDADEAWDGRVRRLLKQVARGEKLASLADAAQALLDEADEGDEDLEDEGLQAAAKAWQQYQPVMTSVAKGLVNIATTEHPDPRKTKALAGRMLAAMHRLPDVNDVVVKAIHDRRAWAAWPDEFKTK